MRQHNLQDELSQLQPQKEFFVGIDSDGCAFDTMEIKQKECFCPNFIRYFNLQPVSKYARETWEFVNLYSKSRGVNRFPALVEAMRLRGELKEVKARGASVIELSPLATWISGETKLGNPTLEKAVRESGNALLILVLEWSKKVNRDIEEMVHGIGPFPFVKQSLDKMIPLSDLMVVSQTPLEALTREWKENRIDRYLRIIAGQEYGTKSEHLALAAKGKYPDEKILMIGDAFGDLKAAQSNGVLFFPINPGHEEASWERFYREGFDRFVKGSYKGDYEDSLVKDFKKYLPELPPWKTN